MVLPTTAPSPARFGWFGLSDPSGTLFDPDGWSDYSNRMNYRDIITIEPDKRGGKPCIRGLRITVYDILEYLAGGMTEDEVLREFQGLTREDVKAVLEFAAARERKLAGSSAV